MCVCDVYMLCKRPKRKDSTKKKINEAEIKVKKIPAMMI